MLKGKGPKNAWQQLFIGVSLSKKLQVLRFNHMPISADVLSMLGEALRTNV